MEGPFEVASLNVGAIKILGDPGVVVYLEDQEATSWEFVIPEAEALDLARSVLCSLADSNTGERGTFLADSCKRLSAYIELH